MKEEANLDYNLGSIAEGLDEIYSSVLRLKNQAGAALHKNVSERLSFVKVEDENAILAIGYNDHQ